MVNKKYDKNRKIDQLQRKGRFHSRVDQPSWVRFWACPSWSICVSSVGLSVLTQSRDDKFIVHS